MSDREQPSTPGRPGEHTDTTVEAVEEPDTTDDEGRPVDNPSG